VLECSIRLHAFEFDLSVTCGAQLGHHFCIGSVDQIQSLECAGSRVCLLDGVMVALDSVSDAIDVYDCI